MVEFAILLLAQFKETRAQEAFLRFFSAPGERGLALTDDLMADTGAPLLASVCGSDPAPLLRLIRDEEASTAVHEEAVVALGVQWLWGERSRQAVVDDWRQLFQTLPKHDTYDVWTALVCAVCDFNIPELAPEARQTYADDLVDEDVLDAAGFEKTLFERTAERDARFKARFLPVDAVAETAAWVCFDATRPLPPLMAIPDILRALERVGPHVKFEPYAKALTGALEHREAIVPELVAAIERVCAEPRRFLDDPDASLHRFAVLLLAQFKDPRACDAILRLYSLPGKQALELTEGPVDNREMAILASVCGDDPAPLLALVGNEEAHDYFRSQAIGALGILWRRRRLSREALAEHWRGLFQTLPKPGRPFLWGSLAVMIGEFQITELAPETLEAFAENLVDKSLITPDQFETFLRQDKVDLESRLAELAFPINAMSEAFLWPCFRPAQGRDAGFGAQDPDWTGTPEALPPAVPFVAPPKPGRNDPCPCGSGKKYKKCCAQGTK